MPERPNILIILTDDQPLGTLGVMPATRRWFAKQGTRFTNAYATTPSCCPSRGSIMSGRYAHNHGVLTNRDGRLLDERSTIQRFLQRQGYRTAMVGKYLNRWDLSNPPRYFDRWTVFNGGYFDARFNVDGEERVIGRYSTDFIADRAIGLLRWFEQEGEGPWYLYVTPFAPHGRPFHAAPRHRDAPVPDRALGPAVLETDLSDKPPFIRREASPTPDEGETRRVNQLRQLLAVDDLVDRVMKELRRLGQLDDTLAFFLSDNGMLWGEHGITNKRLPYTRSIKVPLLARWPDRVLAGHTDDRLVGNADIFPTILEAVGDAPDPLFPIDGHSLLGSHRRDRILTEYWEDRVSRYPGWASLRTEHLQYTEYYEEGGRRTFREYYDLAADPWQTENLLAEGPSRGSLRRAAGRLSEMLRRDRECRGTVGTRACP